jgi:chorismate synthase
VAKKVLTATFGVQIVGYVVKVGKIEAVVDSDTVTLADVEKDSVRCPDPEAAERMRAHIKEARKAGDSLGGVVEVVARGVPLGLGEPVFDKLEADLAKAMLSIPACKGFESGSGFAGAAMTGTQHNDLFYMAGDRVRTRTNRSGGIQGGISNGEPVLIRAAFKPTATIAAPQQTVDIDGNETTVAGRGRHDPCVVPRAVPIAEAMMALVLADHALRQRGQTGQLEVP